MIDLGWETRHAWFHNPHFPRIPCTWSARYLINGYNQLVAFEKRKSWEGLGQVTPSGENGLWITVVWHGATMWRKGRVWRQGAMQGPHQFISMPHSTIRNYLPWWRNYPPWWRNWTSQWTTNHLKALLKTPLHIKSRKQSLDAKQGHGVPDCIWSLLSVFRPKYNTRHVPLDIKTVTFNFLQALMFCIKERIKSQGFDEEEKQTLGWVGVVTLAWKVKPLVTAWWHQAAQEPRCESLPTGLAWLHVQGRGWARRESHLLTPFVRAMCVQCRQLPKFREYKGT